MVLSKATRFSAGAPGSGEAGMKVKYLLVLAILLAPALYAQSTKDKPSPTQPAGIGLQKSGAKPALSEAYGKLPMSFEAWTEPASDVKFSSRGQGYNLSLTPKGAVLTLQGGIQDSGFGIQEGSRQSSVLSRAERGLSKSAIPNPKSRTPNLRPLPCCA